MIGFVNLLSIPFWFLHDEQEKNLWVCTLQQSECTEQYTIYQIVFYFENSLWNHFWWMWKLYTIVEQRYLLRDECALKCEKSIITSYENDVTRTFKNLFIFLRENFQKNQTLWAQQQLNKAVAVRWTGTIMLERFCEEMHLTMNMYGAARKLLRPYKLLSSTSY